MYEYLYAAVERLPRAWRPPSIGFGWDPPASRRVGDVVVIASPVDTLPVATPKMLALHHDVVAATMDAETVMPFRFGTLVPAGELDRWMAVRAARIRTTFAELRGHVEMNVKLLRLTGGGNGKPAGLAAHRRAEDLRPLAEELADRADLPHWRYRAAASVSNIAAAVAFLVPRHAVSTFLSRIAPVASRAVGVAVVPTGPWPAYSFSPALDRLPLAHVPRVQHDRAQGRRLDAALARAGRVHGAAEVEDEARRIGDRARPDPSRGALEDDAQERVGARPLEADLLDEPVADLLRLGGAAEAGEPDPRLAGAG